MSIFLRTVAFAFLACVIVAATAKQVTEAELKAMKVKQLKSFLDERGIICKECQEKADFVRKALKHMNDKVVNAAPPKVEVPTVPLWEAWAGFASQECKTLGGKDDVCDSVKNAVESAFMQHGRRTATNLKKKPSDILKTSVHEPYHAAGRRIVKALSRFAMKNSVTSLAKLQAKFEKKFIPWMTNVGIENTNPMYEALKEKDEL